MQGLSVSKNKKLYRKVSPTEVETVDLIGQYQFSPKGRGKKYQMTTKNRKTIYFQAVNMIDSATVWIEFRTIPSAGSSI